MRYVYCGGSCTPRFPTLAFSYTADASIYRVVKRLIPDAPDRIIWQHADTIRSELEWSVMRAHRFRLARWLDVPGEAAFQYDTEDVRFSNLAARIIFTVEFGDTDYVPSFFVAFITFRTRYSQLRLAA